VGALNSPDQTWSRSAPAMIDRGPPGPGLVPAKNMSDHEFNNYLTLLAGLLRLGDKQRRAIAEELRTHLEDRVEELLARGVSRDEAVQRALAEFGDAAGL